MAQVAAVAAGNDAENYLHQTRLISQRFQSAASILYDTAIH